MINRLPLKKFRLVTLGRLALLDASGREEASVGSRRRKLALLAILAIEKRSMSRDHLAELFWGDRDDSRAKHSLSDAVSHLRQVLGPQAIVATRTDVALAPDAPLDVDVLELVMASDRRDDERVVADYTGPFLDSVHLGASHTFELWADQRRGQYERLFVAACQRLGERLLQSGRTEEALDVARRWLNVEPMSERAALLLLDAHAAEQPDGNARALMAYESLRERLRREMDLAPPPAVETRARKIAALVEQSPAASVPPAPAGPARHDTGVVSTPSNRAARNISLWRSIAAVGAALGLILVVLFGLTRTPRSNPLPDLGFLILPFTVDGARDTSVAWLGDGFPRMLAAKMSRADIEAFVPGAFSADTLSGARRMGARWLVTGSVARRDTVVRVQVVLRDVRTGDVVRRFAVVGGQVIDAADEVGSTLIAATFEQNPTGPALADVETRSVAAYRHYLEALRARLDGRPPDLIVHLDAAIALDSGFLTAVYERSRHAVHHGEAAILARLLPLFERHRSRLSERDRLEMEARTSFQAGQRDRAEHLARQLVRRYSRDPRSYPVAAEAMGAHGKFHEADSIFQMAARLDSITVSATGLCGPCVDYYSLALTRWTTGDREGAEKIARDFTTRHPELASAWMALLRMLAWNGKYDEALAAGRRGAMMWPQETDFPAHIGLTLLAARNYQAADSVTTMLERQGGPHPLRWAGLLRQAIQRERGQYRLAARTGDELVDRHQQGAMVLVAANSRARAGDLDAAATAYEVVGVHPRDWRFPHPPILWSVGAAARSFAWHHALKADAIAPRCDRVHLRALADSIQAIGAMSYYGRDWRLHHHVRGLVALCDQRYDDAVADFTKARWTREGWTASIAALARAELGRGRPAAAIAALRDAYGTFPEGPAWYVPRTELDYLMAQAFQAGGQRDSALAYSNYVRRAWQLADPEVKARLAALDQQTTKTLLSQR